MAHAIDQLHRPEITTHRAIGHLLQRPGLLIDAPVRLPGHKRTRHLDLLAGEHLEILGVLPPGRRAHPIPVQPALEARPAILGHIHGEILVGQPGMRGGFPGLRLLGHMPGHGLRHRILQRHHIVIRQLRQIGGRPAG